MIAILVQQAADSPPTPKPNRNCDTMYITVKPWPDRLAPLAVRKMAPTIISPTVVTLPHLPAASCSMSISICTQLAMALQRLSTLQRREEVATNSTARPAMSIALNEVQHKTRKPLHFENK